MKSLEEAHKIAAIGVLKSAARSAYYAGFHAAQAMIFERLIKVAKTHSGVRAEFSRLAVELDDPVRYKAFMGQGYSFKEAADYSTKSEGQITWSKLPGLVEDAAAMVDAVEAALRLRPGPIAAPSGGDNPTE